MKIKCVVLVSLMLLFALVFSSCGSVVSPDDDTEKKDTELSDNESSDVTDKEDSEVTDKEDSEVTDKEDDEENKEEKKPVKNILMIGSSFCYYYVEELCGMAAAAGYDINLCNLYYSGCRLSQHWDFYSKNEGVYKFFHTTKDERIETSVTTFKDALDYAKNNLGGDWDVISLQETNYYLSMSDLETAKANSLGYAGKLYDLIKSHTPNAKLYWNETWAFEIGWGVKDRPTPLTTVGQQTAQYEINKALANAVSFEQGVDIIPSGDAWQIARVKLNGQNLCENTKNGQVSTDYYHDGTTGGGQYLNACVWFEVLFGKSCVGNTYRPDYELRDIKINALQRSAHEAVAELYGENYAK